MLFSKLLSKKKKLVLLVFFIEKDTQIDVYLSLVS